MKVSNSQQKVINFLIDNPNGYLYPTDLYHWQRLIKGNGEYCKDWCWRPTRDKLIAIEAIVKNKDGNYILNPNKTHIKKHIKTNSNGTDKSKG